MLWIHDKLYTFYDHFQEQIERRGIRIDWVEQAMLEPDRIGFSKTTGRYLYDKYIPNADVSVRAVVDEEQSMIVTAHYLRERPDQE
jgi:hypothetical protein